jgi:hypothetical protein
MLEKHQFMRPLAVSFCGDSIPALNWDGADQETRDSFGRIQKSGTRAKLALRGAREFCQISFWTINHSSVLEGVRRMDKLERPREIIEYCLTPLALSKATAEYKEVYRRLEHVIKTLQVMAARNNKPVAVDFSQMKTININEAAHGDDI